MNYTDYLMVRGNLLVLLPEQTEQLLRETEGGFDVSTLDAIKYDPAHGTVVGIGPDVNDCLLGDEVFFNKVLWSNAKESAWGSDDQRFLHEFQGHNEFAFKIGDRYYMILPESKVWMVEYIQDGLIVPINGHVIAKPVSASAKFESEFEVISFREEAYQINQVEIVHGGGSLFLSKGDVVQTLKHCDLYVEEKFNSPHLPEEWFIIEEENIISKLHNMEYKAAGRRVIVAPEEVSTEQENGFTNTDALRRAVLTARVVSVGDEVRSCKVGDRIVYARNSGMKLPSLTGGADLLILKDGPADSEIFAVVTNPIGWIEDTIIALQNGLEANIANADYEDFLAVAKGKGLNLVCTKGSSCVSVTIKK